MTFASPSETQSGLRCPLIRSVESGWPDGLPSSTSLDLGSSHGVVIDPPLHRYGRLVSTPGTSAAPKSCRRGRLRGDTPCGAEAPSARSCHLPDSFRPCRSSRLRRFAPPGTFQVCCTLKPILGFARLQVVGAHLVHHPRPVRGKPRPVARRLGVPEGIPVRHRRSVRRAHIRRRVCWLPSRPGGQEASSNHSHWRSTLRSFSLTFSCTASTVSPVRTPAAPAGSVNRVRQDAHSVGRPGDTGHRDPCLRAVGHG